MIRTNYFRVIHITIEKIIIENTEPAHDVLRKSPEGPTGNSQGINTKIDDFMKKLFFRSNSLCMTYLFLLFTGRTNIQKL